MKAQRKCGKIKRKPSVFKQKNRRKEIWTAVSYIGDSMKKTMILLLLFLAFASKTVFAQEEICVEIDGHSYREGQMSYPLIRKNNTVYLPLTAENLAVLGLKYEFKQGKLEFTKVSSLSAEDSFPSLSEDLPDTPKSFDYLVNLCGVAIDSQYPVLKYKHILYFPLTWKNCAEILHWDYHWNGTHLVIGTEKDNSLTPQENFTVAGEDGCYHLDGAILYQENAQGERKVIYRLPETATQVEMNIVQGKLYLHYYLGHSPQSPQRQVVFEGNPRELYSGKYRYFSNENQEYLLRNEILRSNLALLKDGEEVDFTQSKYVFRTGVNGWNVFTQSYGNLFREQQFLASTDGRKFDRIVSVDRQGNVKEILQDSFLIGFTTFKNHLMVWNDYGIYTYDPHTASKKVLVHTDALRVFPSEEPIYLHQNNFLYQGKENVNPMGQVDSITETVDGEKTYTIFQFRGDGKYRTMVLCNGKFVLKTDISVDHPTILDGKLYYYNNLSRRVKTLSLE